MLIFLFLSIAPSHWWENKDNNNGYYSKEIIQELMALFGLN